MGDRHTIIYIQVNNIDRNWGGAVKCDVGATVANGVDQSVVLSGGVIALASQGTATCGIIGGLGPC